MPQPEKVKQNWRTFEKRPFQTVNGCGWCVLNVDSESIWEETWETPTGNANVTSVCSGGEGAKLWGSHRWSFWTHSSLFFFWNPVIGRAEPVSGHCLSFFCWRTSILHPCLWKIFKVILLAMWRWWRVARMLKGLSVAKLTLAVLCCFSLCVLQKCCVLKHAVVTVSLWFCHNFCCCVFCVYFQTCGSYSTASVSVEKLRVFLFFFYWFFLWDSTSLQLHCSTTGPFLSFASDPDCLWLSWTLLCWFYWSDSFGQQSLILKIFWD